MKTSTGNGRSDRWLLVGLTVIALGNTLFAMWAKRRDDQTAVARETLVLEREQRRDSLAQAAERRFVDSLHALERRSPPWLKLVCDSTTLAAARKRARSSDLAAVAWCEEQAK